MYIIITLTGTCLWIFENGTFLLVLRCVLKEGSTNFLLLSLPISNLPVLHLEIYRRNCLGAILYTIIMLEKQRSSYERKFSVFFESLLRRIQMFYCISPWWKKAWVEKWPLVICSSPFLEVTNVILPNVSKNIRSILMKLLRAAS